MKKRYIADLHIHSKYSRAVSKDMNIPTLYQWGRKKGINLIGTGDFTHPFWISDLKDDLESINNGFYKYKGDADGKGPFFVLSSEISCIYSQKGKVHKIHIVFLSPSIEIAKDVNKKLAAIGNIASDGRPILGISAEDLVKTILSVSKEIIVIPAHVWTPWFSLYGSNSGFDSIQECFGEMSSYVRTIETGLSSDPAMNWRIKELQSLQIVSSSDSHSPAKIGREATVLESDFSFTGLKNALEGRNKEDKILYTIEFFPEEGKYHFSGHRNCNVRYSDKDLREKGRICPVCGRSLTVGVTQRVEDLAKITEEDLQLKDWWLGDNLVKGIQSNSLHKPPYIMMVQLEEILSESFKMGTSSKMVQGEYERMLTTFGTEFKILLSIPLDNFKGKVDDRVIDGIDRVRHRNLSIDPGYDGVFGTVKIWSDEAKEEKSQEQISLF